VNVLADGLPNWVMQLWVYQPLLLLLSTVFGAFYVVYTIRTFQQIKRQTDLQIEAFLIVAAKKVRPEDARANFADRAVKLHKKWLDILQKNMPDAIQPDRWLVLKFTNRGRADIVEWVVNVRAHIDSGEYLAENYNVSGEIETWQVRYESHEDMVSTDSGTAIEVPLAILGPFPRAEFRWTVRYRDTRNVEYTSFGGDSTETDINALALPASTAKA
jgi:hypothetical protein